MGSTDGCRASTLASFILAALELVLLSEGYNNAQCVISGRTMNCSNRDLQHIPFRNFSNYITKVDLSVNAIQSIPNTTFERNSGITSLILRKNKIDAIFRTSFQFLHRLEVLDLSHNQLSFIENGSLSRLHLLRSLDLTRNLLQTLPSSEFRGLRNLRSISIGYNPIKWESLEAIILPSRVENINISGLGMKVLPEHLFNNSFHLKSVDISYNNLTSINFKTLQRFDKLREIRLFGNKWTCDCTIRIMKYWLTFQSYLKREWRVLKCDSPSSFSGQSLLNVSYRHLVCETQTRRCPLLSYPTQKPYISEYDYRTGVNIAASLVGMMFIYLFCFAYDKVKRKLSAMQRRRRRRAMFRENQLLRSASSPTQLIQTAPQHTVSFMLGERNSRR